MSLIGIGETAIYNNKHTVTITDHIKNKSNIIIQYEFRMPLGGVAVADIGMIRSFRR